MARRNRGLGAVFLRADGRWEGQIRIGGGRRRSFYARTRRDLVHKLADARWALGEGLPLPRSCCPRTRRSSRWSVSAGKLLDDPMAEARALASALAG